MTIHTVTPGQTLTAISALYGVGAGLIAGYNGLTPPYDLAVGQSLLIPEPAQLYTVQPGDTLTGIAAQNGLSVNGLLRRNPGLGGDAALFPGQTLILRDADAPGREIEVNGYAYPFVNESILRAILPCTSYLTPFTYGISEDAGLVPLDDERLLALAREYGVRPLMHLSTLTENGNFSTERAARVLNDPALSARLIESAVRTVNEKGYRGLDLDFEFLGADNAAPYAAFASRLREALGGLPLVTALAPKTSDAQPGLLYEGHDYAARGAASDAVLLMTYEWGYTYGPPMAVAPLNNVRRVVEYALTRIPPEKILLGFPNYAYDWTLPFEAGTSRAQSISNERAVELAVRYGAEILYDETAQTPHFSYLLEGRAHEVWFEDPRSALAKYELVDRYGLRGVGFWNYMRPFAAGFALLGVMFDIAGNA